MMTMRCILDIVHWSCIHLVGVEYISSGVVSGRLVGVSFD